MGGLPKASALLLGADDTLQSLLSDVLEEVGIHVSTRAGPGLRPELVLVLVQRSESMLSALQRARDGTYPAPVFVLVPFADERQIQLALRLGARGCFALGRPLEELRRMLLEVVPGEVHPPGLLRGSEVLEGAGRCDE